MPSQEYEINYFLLLFIGFIAFMAFIGFIMSKEKFVFDPAVINPVFLGY